MYMFLVIVDVCRSQNGSEFKTSGLRHIGAEKQLTVRPFVINWFYTNSNLI